MLEREGLIGGVFGGVFGGWDLGYGVEGDGKCAGLGGWREVVRFCEVGWVFFLWKSGVLEAGGVAKGFLGGERERERGAVLVGGWEERGF